jgi:hypothetical protein
VLGERGTPVRPVGLIKLRARVTIKRMKKALGWILLILLIFYIGTNPGPAADIATSLGDGIANVFRNIGTFFSELAN